MAYRRWRAADIRSILATAGAAPTPRPAGQALADVLTLPMVPTRSWRPTRSTLAQRPSRGDRVTAAPPALAGRPDRRTETAEDGCDAPPGTRAVGHREDPTVEPEEFLRTLVEAEIAARDASNAATRRRQAGFPVTKTLDDYDLTVSSVPQATFDYLPPSNGSGPRRTCA